MCLPRALGRALAQSLSRAVIYQIKRITRFLLAAFRESYIEIYDECVL